MSRGRQASRPGTMGGVRARRASWFAMGMWLACSDVQAAFHESELKIAARALQFLDKPLVGEVITGILYEPTQAPSVDEANTLLQLIGDGLRVGTVILKPLLVPVSDAAHVKVGLYLLTDGVGPAAAVLAEVVNARHILCVTTDLAQVVSGNCVLGVRAQPQVQILLSRKAADASGATFSSVFRIMITET